MAMQEEIQSNHLLMWLHQSTLRILVMLNHFLKCNMLPRPVLNENVACVQEKVFFFFLSHYLEKLTWEGFHAVPNTEADHTE